MRTAGGFFVDVTIHDLDTARYRRGRTVPVEPQRIRAGVICTVKQENR